ncbi:hypothetical protein TWF217_009440 [Orbilia oligospora]|nr:hypothetical protein TWF217_009440 [Orbilia oligospora]
MQGSQTWGSSEDPPALIASDSIRQCGHRLRFGLCIFNLGWASPSNSVYPLIYGRRYTLDIRRIYPSLYPLGYL